MYTSQLHHQELTYKELQFNRQLISSMDRWVEWPEGVAVSLTDDVRLTIYSAIKIQISES